MEKNKKNYYNKNNQKKKYYKNDNEQKKSKMTYDKLMRAETLSTIPEVKNDIDYDKVLVMKYIAVSIVLLTIIIASLLLFRQM